MKLPGHIPLGEEGMDKKYVFLWSITTIPHVKNCFLSYSSHNTLVLQIPFQEVFKPLKPAPNTRNQKGPTEH